MCSGTRWNEFRDYFMSDLPEAGVMMKVEIAVIHGSLLRWA